MALSSNATATDLYIAPNGNDSNSGASSSPFATINGARDAIRAMRPGPIGINGATEVTISCWVNPDVKTPNDGILTCTGSTFFGLVVAGSANGYPGEFRAMGVSLKAADNTVPENQWSHVAGVWKSGQIHKLYINGVEAANNASPPSGAVDASSWFLGADRGISGRNLDAKFRGAYVWDRALSASEISGLAASMPSVPSGFDISKPEEVDISGGLQLEQNIPELPQAMNVFLRGGRYRIDTTASLTAQDSGTANKLITYKAYPGEQVIFDGSKAIGGNGFALTSDTKLQPVARGRTYVKTITDTALINLLKNQSAQISVDDRMMQLSRFPNLGYDRLTRHSGDVQSNTQGTPTNPVGAVVSMRKTFRGDWQAELSRIQKARIIGYVSADWYSESLRIHSITSNNRMRLVDGSRYGWKDSSRYVQRAYVSNLLCEIDEPGEWYFDDIDSKLYIWPPAAINSSTEIGVWAGPSMISVESGRHLRFENLTMQCIGNSAGGFLNINNCDNVVAAGCTFRYCPPGGPVAVNITGASTNCGVLSSDYYDVHNANRLYGAGSTNNSFTASNNFIENCHFTQIWSKSFYGKVAGIIGTGNIFRNNLMHNHNGQAVTIGGQDHKIELNEIFNTGIEEGDGGSFYQGNSFTSWGNTFKHNFWHHIMCIPQLIVRSAVFSDDGDLGDVVNENVFYKAAENFKINQGAGHYGEKNVMIQSIYGFRSLGRTPVGDYNNNMNLLNTNPLANTKGALLPRGFRKFGADGYLDTINSNNWNTLVSPVWRNKYPRLDNLFNRWWNDKAMTKYNDFDRNIFYGNTGGTIARVSSATTLTNSVNLSNLNNFVDPSKLNFKFKAPLPSWAPNIPFEKIGLYVDAYRTTTPDKDAYREAVRKNWEGQNSAASGSYNADTVNARIYFNTGKLLFGIPDTAPATFVDLTATSYNYDFGTKSSPVFNNWVGIHPETNGEISWSGPVNAIDRGSVGSINEANRDLIYSNQPRTLEHKIANGAWKITINMGDALAAHDNMSVRAEGELISADVDSAAGEFRYVEKVVDVTDGSLSLEFADNGGNNGDWVVTRLSLTRVGDAPPPGEIVVDTSLERYDYDFGTPTSPVFSGWTRISPITNGDVSWSGAVLAVDRGSANVNAANRDLVYSSNVRTLNHRIANGTWNVLLNMGDRDYLHDNMTVRAEGGQVVRSNISNNKGQFTAVSFSVNVTDGELNLEFSDQGGDPNWVVTRLTLTKSNNPPPPPSDNVTVDTNLTKYDYDFGTPTSPVFSGWTRISPITTGDISWSGAVLAVDRGSANVNAANQDLVYSSNVRTLSHKIANGTWNVYLNMGDRDYPHDNMQVSAEGGQVVRSNISNARGQFPGVGFDVVVSDGQLDLEFSDQGGDDQNWVVTRMSITKVVTSQIAGADIGNTSPAGSTTDNGNGSFTIQGSGADIWGASDAFQFASETTNGADGTLSVRVDSFSNTNGWAKAGVHYRGSNAAGAKHVSVFCRPDGQVAMQWRTNTNGSSSWHGTLLGGAGLPKWVRLTKSGDSFTGAWSTNGTSWTDIRTVTVAMTGDNLKGLAVTSHNNGTLATAEFSNFVSNWNSNSATAVASIAPSAVDSGAFVAADVYRYDFGTADSSLQSGYQRVSELNTAGYFRWANASGITSTNRASGGSMPDLLRDFNGASSAQTFVHQVENGEWEIKLSFFDPDVAHNDIFVRAEGINVATNIDVNAGQLVERTVTATVSDGELNLQLDSSGADWILNGLVLTKQTATGNLTVGSTVYLKGNNGRYVTSGSPMICNSTTTGSAQEFTIVDGGNGTIAFRSSANQFVSSENGNGPINSNRSSAGSWERFTVDNIGNNVISIKGNNNRYISSENGSNPMTCNRTAVGSWERFTWEAK